MAKSAKRAIEWIKENEGMVAFGLLAVLFLIGAGVALAS